MCVLDTKSLHLTLYKFSYKLLFPCVFNSSNNSKDVAQWEIHYKISPTYIILTITALMDITCQYLYRIILYIKHKQHLCTPTVVTYMTTHIMQLEIRATKIRIIRSTTATGAIIMARAPADNEMNLSSTARN